MSCPICRSPYHMPVVCRTNVPVAQCTILDSFVKARNVLVGDLTIERCNDCGFVFNSSFNKAIKIYDEDYNNINLSTSYFQYLDTIVQRISKSIPYQGKIIEVGCGQGLFLKGLCELRSDITAIGYDPSYKGRDVLFDGRLRFEKHFLEDSILPNSIDVVVCRHVIEHIPMPVPFLKTLFNTLMRVQSCNLKVVFETPCNEWILQNQVYWDFFYEHCSIFSAHSLWIAFQATGFYPEVIDWVFEGQYLWIESWFNPVSDEAISKVKATTTPAIKHFNHKIFLDNKKKWELEWSKKLKSLPKNIGVIGAGAKGVTFVNIFDPDNKIIKAVVDVSPQKHGKYIPGSGHKIIGYGDIVEHFIKCLILLNPNYFDENHKKLQLIDSSIKLIV